MNLMNRIYNDKDFMAIASSILSNKEFLKTKSIVHHGNTRYNHLVRVAYTSYILSRVLGCDINSATRAAALHDFFLVRDDKSMLTSAKMLIEHPSLAKRNAINCFGINEKEQNIIESHMFPISSVMPKSKEAWIVTFSDKVVAMVEGALRAKANVSMWILFIFNFIK